MCKIIKISDYREKDRIQNDININVEYNIDIIYEELILQGYDVLHLRYNTDSFIKVINEVLLSTHGWLAEFATEEDIMRIIECIIKY